ncbi:MAG: hypothetical protein IPO08_23285 [Xanthomonadales bacterium]|nr:hypothetical protein [Xanthomonadales bacterium]
MKTTERQIAEWEKLSDAATPGPWGRAGTEVTAKSIGYASVCDTETDNDKMCENAAFIAAAREAIPALIADLRDARETISRLTAQAEALLLHADIKTRREEREAKLAEAEKDAKRYRWLTDDHDSRDTRKACHDILARMPVMSYSAASQTIDAAIAAQEKP